MSRGPISHPLADVPHPVAPRVAGAIEDEPTFCTLTTAIGVAELSIDLASLIEEPRRKIRQGPPDGVVVLRPLGWQGPPEPVRFPSQLALCKPKCLTWTAACEQHELEPDGVEAASRVRGAAVPEVAHFGWREDSLP